MPSAMLTYVLATVPAQTLAFLNTPTEAVLAPVLASSIHQYNPNYTLEAQCTDLDKFYAIGLYRFWQWAVEVMQATKFTPTGAQSSTEWNQHLEQVKDIRDLYASQIPGDSGAAIIVSSVVTTTDPYVIPRASDI